MMESGVPLCSTCGEPVGLSSADKEEVFVACQGCNYPLCSACLEDEIREGRDSCLRCGEPYVRNVTGSIFRSFSEFAFNVVLNKSNAAPVSLVEGVIGCSSLF